MTRRMLGVLAAVALSIGGAAALVDGARLRFHVENTDEALVDQAHGGVWLAAAAALFLGAAVAAAVVARAPGWATALVSSPILLGVGLLLLLPGNVLPFGTAALSLLLCVIGLVATLIAPRWHAPH